MSSNTRPTPTVEELSRHIEEQQQQIASLRATLAARPSFPRLNIERLHLVLLAMIFFPLVVTSRADIPNATGVITGCYHNANGKLRVIDVEAGNQCSDQETQLTWNQAGPEGPTR